MSLGNETITNYYNKYEGYVRSKGQMDIAQFNGLNIDRKEISRNIYEAALILRINSGDI